MTLQDHLEKFLSIFVRLFDSGVNYISREFPAIAEISDFVLVAILILLSWIVRNLFLAIASRSAGLVRLMCLFLGHTIGLPAILLAGLFSLARAINISANQGTPLRSPATNPGHLSDFSSKSNSRSMSNSVDSFSGQISWVHIQVLDGDNWQTVMSIQPQVDNVSSSLRMIKQQHSDRRIRAVDDNDRVLDMLS